MDGVENQNLPSFPDKEGKQCRARPTPESMQVVPSLKMDGKRRRGRAAGPIAKKGKARRTRPRIEKPGKIYENESDASDSGGKMQEEGTETGANHRILDVESKECPPIQETEIVEDSESSQRENTSEKEVPLDNIHELLDRAQDIELDNENKVDNGKKTEKLDVMVDPVQAMLLDMIPSLGVNAESTIPVIYDKKPLVEQGPQPVKKKKVSYKDVAGALLNEW